ncbi:MULTISPECIES: adenylate/guanylate cyclase domain-containing protein [unclassified Ruegeria]|uniref:adenylate/guanylate cyclase domain-containing protein n=1 Tax=unclassified Ruegeria TaxID=2625375 RepID=UPI001492EE81|nr:MULTISPECIES: adenylate/guanylate cyclase domain-containing protein [unclassified Ruegeria]NOD33652.1 adenylate/guanylate cyclase domain-containing protein [Ruegeria sp. HKCCD7296]NOE40673.1 adenylate/guanylate cyclase domain-containing protein [Ruegeria sp. HKCCD7319]
MSILAINEQLLRAIGVGVAVVRASDLEFVFHNGPFAEWFGVPEEGNMLTDILPDLDSKELEDVKQSGLRYSVELQIKPKRRTLIFAVAVSLANGLSEQVLIVECQNITRIRELESMIDSYSTMVERNTRELEREKERVERLLLNLMPKAVYEEFKTFGVVTPQLYQQVSVVMLDFVGFTDFAAKTDPTVTLSELNDIFTAFDRIVEQFGCERIKTIGDAYLAVSGMPDPTPDHATAVAHCAVRFLRYLERRNESHPHKWQARIGLGMGAAVGSVVGIQKYVYDVFGPAVNIASRLQVFANPMNIVAPEEMKYALIDEFQVSDLGCVDIKGIGEMDLINVTSGLSMPQGNRLL